MKVHRFNALDAAETAGVPPEVDVHDDTPTSPVLRNVRADLLAELDRLSAAGFPHLADWARKSPANFRAAMRHVRGGETRSRPARSELAPPPGGALHAAPSWRLPSWRL